MTQVTTSATYKTLITADLPDFGSRDITFRLVAAFFNAAGEEVIDGTTYTMTLDAAGNDDGAFYLPTPDNTGAAGANWFVTLPSGYEDIVTVAYSGTAQAVSDLLAAGSTTTDPDVITAALAGKQAKDLTATNGYLAIFASGQTVAGAGAPGTAAYAATGDFDAAGSAAAAIASLGGADGTVTDEQLRNWAGRALALMTSVTRTDYSKSWTGTDGKTKYAGFIAVTGTVTWPDGVTGHLDGVEYPDSLGILQYFTASHVASGKIVVQSPLINGAAGYTVVTPDYYVDSAAAGGGDGSLATPYNTLAALAAGETLQTGDVVALKSGSTFAESVDFSDGVSFSIYRYGAGNKPILDARDTIAAGSWSIYGAGAGSTYQASVTWQPSASGIVVSLVPVWEDGALKSVGGSATTLNVGEYFIATPSAGSGTLYYRASDDGDLSAGTHEIKFAARYGGLETIQSSGGRLANMVIDGIRTIGNCSDSGQVVVGRSAVLRHLYTEDGTKHNIYTEDGLSIYGCIFDNGKYAAGLSLLVLNENTPAQLTNTIDACALMLDAAAASTDGIFSHQNVSGSFGQITASNCYASKIRFASVTEADGVTIIKCAVVDSNFGSLTISQKIIDSIIVPVATTPSLCSVSATNLVIEFIGCKFTIGITAELSNGAINWSVTGCTIKFANMVFDTNATSGIQRMIYPLTATTTIVATGCQFLKTSGYGYAVLFANTLSPSLAWNNNVYRQQSWRYNSTQYNAIADWRAATGQDVGSIAY